MKFGHQFYPTPFPIIQKMLEAAGGIDGKIVLEPSAGNGAILDAVKPTFSRGARLVYGIEIDPTLHAACAAKGHRMLGSNFLDFGGRPDINCILMNPPFDDADTHILHAWQVLHEGVIVAQCNINTILNPSTSERERLVALIEKYGHWESIGKCYIQADRKADVEVALIVLHKEAKRLFEFDDFQQRKDQDFNIGSGSAINFRDPIKARVNQYDSGVAALATAYRGLLQAFSILKPLMDGRDLMNMFNEATKHGNANAITDMIDEVTKAAWGNIFSTTKIGDLVSSDVKKEFEAQKMQLGKTAFTVENIMQFGAMAYGQAEQLTNLAIVRAFDLITEYSWGEKNRENIKGHGWKTNAPYRVRQKFILPWSDAGGYRLIRYHAMEQADDLQKAMCLLAGITFTDGTVKDLDKDGNEIQRPWKRFTWWGTGDRIDPHVDEYDSEFFHIKRYGGAGTLHFTFKDLDLWARFNIAAIRLKGYELSLDNDTNHTGRHWKRKTK